MAIRTFPTTEEIDDGWTLPAKAPPAPPATNPGFSPFFTAAYLAHAGEPPQPPEAFPKVWEMRPLRRRSGYAASGA